MDCRTIADRITPRCDTPTAPREEKKNPAGKTFKELTAGVSQEEVNQRIKDHLCARCAKTGHTAFTCPEKVKIGTVEVTEEADEQAEAYRESYQIDTTTTPDEEDEIEQGEEDEYFR